MRRAARAARPRRRDPARRAGARRPVRHRPGRRAARAAAPRRASCSGWWRRSRRARTPPWPSRRSHADATRHYGIVAPAGAGDDPFPIAGVVEKPAPGAAPSRLAIAGRYAATPALLDALRDTPRGSGGEVQLSDALSALDAVVAVRLAPGEERLDVGTVPGYCAAFVEYALSDAELGPALRARAATLLDGHR